ncbi:MAG TPA: GNAT family N-acetyltransferase [Dehalococcoidia bacterium]|nr:GNAT family N-acetyltransferase [Dehalococcoidia bacterium]
MSSVEVLPLTPERWPDLEALFGPRGAVGGCWCMWWRVPASAWESGKGEPNRKALRAIVDDGQSPGLLAYLKGKPVGWCSVAPRQDFTRLQRSRVLKPVDDTPVWSVVCFFIARGHRSKGVGSALLRAATDFAAGRGAAVVEGYPVDPKVGRMPDTFAYTGVPSMFIRAGFEEVERRSPGRPIMRKRLASTRP